MTLGFIRAFLLFCLKVPMILIGIPVVWLAVRGKLWTDSEKQVFSQYPRYGSWQRVRLPRWALMWDNAFDGLWGDKRGWWANYCADQYNEPHDSFKSMFMWAALRNPANYFSRNVCGVDVSKLVIIEEKSSGDPNAAPYKGWYLLKGCAENRKVYPRFYLQWAIKGTHGLMIDLGWKIKLSHNNVQPDAPEKDRIKGLVWVVSVWKELS